MDQDQISKLELLIGRLDTRLSRIERQLGQRQPEERLSAPPEVPVTPETIPGSDEAEEPKTRSSANLLGIVGVGCLILAMILLIKFSIDSGWLTPVRQLLLAAVFGSALIAAPFALKLSDKSYLSLLPAAGVVVLHLTNYGAIFYHQLMNPILGITLIWGIGVLSLWLLNHFRHDLYVVLAIAGTYLGSALVKLSFASLVPIAINVLIWDIVFTGMAIRLRNRILISITAYFALGVVSLYYVIDSTANMSNAGDFAVIQFLQILVFSLGTALYSMKNKIFMTEKEAWQLFPVYLFFYGLEFSLLDSLNPHLATGFSITFSLLLLGLYAFTRTRTKTERFESSHAVLTLVSLMLIHSIYVVNLSDTGRMIFGLIPMVLIGLYGKTLKSRGLYGLLILCLLVFGLSTLLVVLNPSDLAPIGIISLGLIFGGGISYGYRASKEFPILILSHGLIILSLCRLGAVIGEIWVAPITVVYAYAALVWGLRWQDKNLGRSAFPVIFFAIGRFLFYNFGGLSQGERIITLVVMGGLIYAGGYVYRKIPELKSPEAEED